MEAGVRSNAIASFTDKFQTQKDEIDKELEISCTLDDKSRLPDHLTGIEKRIEALQKHLTDSVGFLRPYDVRVCQESLKFLRDSCANQRETLIPKKKFVFKSRKKETETKQKISATDCIDGPIGRLSYDRVNCGFENLSGQRLVKREREIADNEVDIRGLDECQVFLIGCPSTVRFNRLRRCQVFVGPVKTSVFVDSCTECVLMLACQQLRVHSSVDSDFYLHVTSGPIIEDSTRIRVAPYAFSYAGIDVHFAESGLSNDNNNWSLVNDFNWLAADMNSPNWQIIPSQERKDARNVNVD